MGLLNAILAIAGPLTSAIFQVLLGLRKLTTPHRKGGLSIEKVET